MVIVVSGEARWWMEVMVKVMVSVNGDSGVRGGKVVGRSDGGGDGVSSARGGKVVGRRDGEGGASIVRIPPVHTEGMLVNLSVCGW
ncbi:hypothetical protein Pmani_019149 [Petrolisthes manimaculis]|uniref:Uncharacterized protein n=1 Tax=Petrolisthes manimaculis TaxID=1843537 RepID=A0AAE1PIX2_9EUCA|nr:hypothetical protein Pmani_019149 [Petrolisthes manimaculis]